MKLKNPHYRRGVCFVAYNDEAAITDEEKVRGMLSVGAISAAFDLPTYAVAKDVIAVREAEKNILPPQLEETQERFTYRCSGCAKEFKVAHNPRGIRAAVSNLKHRFEKHQEIHCHL